MSKTKVLNLLYVEDDEALREQFLRVLKPAFNEVYEAADGVEAYEMYQTCKPDLMVVDINIPKMSGLELIEKIRKEDENTPIMILSAYSDREKLLKAVTLGLSQYMIKPVPYKELLTSLEKMAAGYEKKKSAENNLQLQGPYVWRQESQTLFYGNDMITLTKRERQFLTLLTDNLNHIVNKDEIIHSLWDYEVCEDPYNAFGHFLKRLRKKLPEALIENLYGEGYRISSS
ncbi:response regulator transcription factor [Sulfurovum sp. NBC37-1]|uniref:response regulator transcription factor n=1 Tax=Sulfurovum sp. (strain NBC37-1) TaxID=387093 RepID=UPI0001587A78|nr:response regulator transcription factor [Sulfurovum sp. NBC37-1]BAF73316.1 two-component response regulator [Sulfurovum sp. NBC37-1]